MKAGAKDDCMQRPSSSPMAKGASLECRHIVQLVSCRGVLLFQYHTTCGRSKRAWELFRAEGSENTFTKYQRSRDAHRCKAELPKKSCKVPGTQCVWVWMCVGGQSMLLGESGASWNHCQHNPSVCLHLPACCTAAVWQGWKKNSTVHSYCWSPTRAAKGYIRKLF